MIEAFAPNGSDHSLHIGSLPRRARCRQDFADAHVSHLFSEVIAKDGITVTKQVARGLVKGERFSQLLSRPLRGRVGGHIEVQNATPVMGHYQKHVKNLETEGGYGEEVDGDQLLGMILQKGAPGLRRRLAAAHHVFADAALPDVDAEFEQLAVDAGCTPTGILPAHFADQISDLARNDRSSGLAAPHFPGPEQTKAGTMPGKDGLGLNDGQRGAPVAPQAGQTHPRQAVPGGQFGAPSCGPLQHADLVAQSQVLQLKGGAGTEDRGQSRKECRKKNEHRKRELRKKYNSPPFRLIGFFERHRPKTASMLRGSGLCDVTKSGLKRSPLSALAGATGRKLDSCITDT